MRNPAILSHACLYGLVLTLSLGIGGTTAIFTLIHAVMDVQLASDTTAGSAIPDTMRFGSGRSREGGRIQPSPPTHKPFAHSVGRKRRAIDDPQKISSARVWVPS